MRRGLSVIAVIGAAWAGAVAAQPGEGQTPVPNGGAWMIASPGQAIECTARVNGPQIDTMLTANNAGKMVLVAGRADWNNPGATAPASLWCWWPTTACSRISRARTSSPGPSRSASSRLM